MAWQKFFGYAQNGLGGSKRGGTKHTSQATLINKRLDAFVAGSVVPELPPKKTTKTKSSKPSQPLFASRVSAKLSMGDVRGAVTVNTSSISGNKRIAPSQTPPHEKDPNLHRCQLLIPMATNPISGSPKRMSNGQSDLSKKEPQVAQTVFVRNTS